MTSSPGGGRGASVVALVPAAGMGTRLGAGLPKAFVELAGHTLLERAVVGLLESAAVDDVVVMVPELLYDHAVTMMAGRATVVVGGAERTDSVRAGLAAAGDAGIILVHDAARCLTPPGVIGRVVEAVAALGDEAAVVPVLPVVDTVKVVDGDVITATPDRSVLRAVQTPQGFSRDLLEAAHAAAVRDGIAATDDAGLVERLGIHVRTVEGDPLAFKITTPIDMALARALVDG